MGDELDLNYWAHTVWSADPTEEGMFFRVASLRFTVFTV